MNGQKYANWLTNEFTLAITSFGLIRHPFIQSSDDFWSSHFPFLLRVKLAIDLRTKQQVAVKILKVKEGRATEFSKYQSLDCLYSEISILADCDHNNVVKIKATSFDGTIVKELIPNRED